MNRIVTNVLLITFGVITVTLSSCFKEAVNESLGFLNEETSLYTVRNLYKGADLVLNKENLGGAKYTSGIVVSNHENGNFPEGYIAIESMWRGKIRGLILKVDDPLKYHAGDSILVDRRGKFKS